MRLRRRAVRILSVSALTDAEWSILLTDDEQVRQLNQQYRRTDRTTDVLSFALADERQPYLLGDVVISVEQAARQAEGGEVEAEIVRLLVHGLCHLCGHDHGQAAERRQMLGAEQRLLEPFGLASML